MKTFLKNLIAIVFTKTKPKWPLLQYDDKIQPHFLFIITPPCSGSTAIAKLLDSSLRTMTLTNDAEGQWLVPGLCEKDRWKPDKEVDYASVKAVWLNAFQNEKRLNPHIDVVIEKSPPNMVRIDKISSQFSKYSFVANNRNPYANCASILYRRHDAEKISSIQRQAILEQLAQDWLMRSYIIKQLIVENEIPLLTYEEFCKNPSSILDVLELPEGVSETIDFKSKVKVKDYKIQSISNQNERQISNLNDEEIECIGYVLKSDNNLMEFFGYQVVR